LLFKKSETPCPAPPSPPRSAFPPSQCTGGCLGDSIGHPICQTAFSLPGPAARHSMAALPRLACRSHHWLQVFEVAATQVVPDKDAPGPEDTDDEEPSRFLWRLTCVASLQTATRSGPVLLASAKQGGECSVSSLDNADRECGQVIRECCSTIPELLCFT